MARRFGVVLRDIQHEVLANRPLRRYPDGLWQRVLVLAVDDRSAERACDGVGAGGTGIAASRPWATIRVATVEPVTGLVTVIVPAPGVPERDSHRGANLNLSGPPSRYRPLISSVGPAVTKGSPRGGPHSAEPEHRGLTRRVTSVP